MKNWVCIKASQVTNDTIFWRADESLVLERQWQEHWKTVLAVDWLTS